VRPRTDTFGCVWQASIRVERVATTAAMPDTVWSLLASPLAWSVRPRPCMVFDLAGDSTSASGDRQWFYLTAASGVAAAAVLEVSVPIPGQALSAQTSGGQTRWELSTGPGRRGTALRIAIARTVPRQAKIDAEVEIREDLGGWLAELAAIADGRRPWPADGMPALLRQECLAAPPAPASVEASASVVTDAPPDRVAQAVSSLNVVRAVQTEHVLSCGYVPGTPADQVGGVRYFVYRLADGTLLAVASLVAASSPTAMMTRQLTPPFGETTYGWAAEYGATRLEVTQRFPAPPAPMSQEQYEAFQAAVTAMAGRYKAAIEARR
jgi:hypothetical protein